MRFWRRADRLGFALAPKRLVDGRMKVRYMYREEPDNAHDSGWRFFAGDESDEHVNDPDNIGLYDVATIAAIDPDIVPYLNSPAGSAFEREEATKPFVAVSDE